MDGIERWLELPVMSIKVHLVLVRVSTAAVYVFELGDAKPRRAGHHWARCPAVTGEVTVIHKRVWEVGRTEANEPSPKCDKLLIQGE